MEVVKKGKRGGKREGAGRPRVVLDGESKVVGLTLPRKEWDKIDKMIEKGMYEGKAHYFRHLHLSSDG